MKEDRKITRAGKIQVQGGKCFFSFCAGQQMVHVYRVPDRPF